MKQRLSKIRSPMRRRVIAFAVGFCLLLAEVFQKRPRARIHWIGNTHRPRRPERLLMLVLLPLAVIVLEQREYLIWAAIWGALFAFMVNGYLLFRFIPRRVRRWGGR